MMQLKDTPNFERDISSKAVVSNNRAALEELKSKRELNKRLSQMESEMSDIKRLLEQLLQKK